MGRSVPRSGNESRIEANIYAERAIDAATKLQRPLQAIAMEFRYRLRRTPLLLPVRHFNSPHLSQLLDETQRGIFAEINPVEFIRTACDRFLHVHPFTFRGRKKKTGSFDSPLGVRFTVTGRNIFHGTRRTDEGKGHTDTCFLAARIRLGGYFEGGFHYDCSRGTSKYCVKFRNCHDAESYYIGNPHLNVFPHDFIL